MEPVIPAWDTQSTLLVRIGPDLSDRVSQQVLQPFLISVVQTSWLFRTRPQSVDSPRALFVNFASANTASRRRSLLSSRSGADRKGAPFLGSLRYSRLCEMTRGSPLSLGPMALLPAA